MRPAVLILPFLATAALADCPDMPEDLDDGITVTYDDGSTTTLVRDGEGMIVERTEYDDGAGSGFYGRSKMGFVYLEIGDTSLGEILGDTTATYDYGPSGLDPMALPDGEGARTTLDRVVTWGDGSTENERVTYETRDYADRDWGGCAYRVLPLHVSHFGADGGRAEVFDYIPDLGVAVFIGIAEDGELASGATPVSISKGVTVPE